MGIAGVCSRLIGELVQVLGVTRSKSSESIDPNPASKPQDVRQVDELMIRALTAVFGMQKDGKIKKEQAVRVVEKLGLMYGEEEEEEEDETKLGDEVTVEEVLVGLEDGSKRNELMREAFKIFDEDGDGFIEAVELKRVLQCLGLDNGWDMSQIEKMLKVVDLNLDGKVDFGEFELMMG